jgi:hypothetical protein
MLGVSSAVAGVALTGGAASAVRRAMFCAPHADDEVLQMGVEILRHLTAGFYVTVVAGSRSSTTGAAKLFDGSRTVCGAHHLVHPHYLNSPDQMSAVRIDEQRSAVEQLGVHEYHPGEVDDNALTVEVWRDILLSRESSLSALDGLFVPTPWETTSGKGNPNHGNAGVALRQLLAEGHFAGVTCRYTVWSRYWSYAGCPTGIQRGPQNDSEKYRLLAAADCYRAYNPRAGSFAIGWTHSVPSDFNAQFVDTTSCRYLVQRYHA